MRRTHGRRRRAATSTVLVAAVLLVLLLAAAPASARRGPGGVTPTLSPMEHALVSNLDDTYAWDVMLKQVYGWGIPNWTRGSTRPSAAPKPRTSTVAALAAEMERIGLEPGAGNGTYIEDFPIDGWEDLGSSATVVSPYTWSITPAKQAYKGDGTGPEGITAPVVDVGYGRWEDFEAAEQAGGVAGKIVLLHRADPMFYGGPSLAEAKARGAVGALMDYPVTAPEILKTDEIARVHPDAVHPSDRVEQARRRARRRRRRPSQARRRQRGRRLPDGAQRRRQITGSVYPDEYIYLGCHFDHWITSAADDGAGVGSMFAIAKALKDLHGDRAGSRSAPWSSSPSTRRSSAARPTPGTTGAWARSRTSSARCPAGRTRTTPTPTGSGATRARTTATSCRRCAASAPAASSPCSTWT